MGACCSKTVIEGEYAKTSNAQGNVTVIAGPATIPFRHRFLEKIHPVVAAESEYIEVHFSDGHTEFIPGPAFLVPHPINHREVQAKAKVQVHRGSALMVYRPQSQSEGAGIECIVLEGLCTYMPNTSTEWTKSVPIRIAADNEYLQIKHLDGRLEFQRGPASLIVDPEKHHSVDVLPATQLGNQELIVVYRQGAADGAVRHLVRGPRMYIPESAMEWMHEFSWTGTSDPGRDIGGPAKKKIDGLKFTKLRTSPGKMYVDVESVRTKDNALLLVKLMVFFHYENIDQMLDNTSDPFGEVINSASADVIEWCVSMKFDEFIANTEHLNTLAAYPQLQTVVGKIGMAVNKVVFRGYEAPSALQKMHDNAIEQRTSLALSREEEEERQKIADLTLQRESARIARQHEMDTEKLDHELTLKNKASEAALQSKRAELQLEMDRLRDIKKIDANADIGRYLAAKEGKAMVVNCSNIFSEEGQVTKIK